MTNIEESSSNYFTFPDRAVEALTLVTRRPEVGTMPPHLQLTVAQACRLGFAEIGRRLISNQGTEMQQYYRLTDSGRALLRVVLSDRSARGRSRTC